ncbi:MAG: exodeoxyribonuclease VII large subunit [Rikenellaceae bacterium]
MSNTSQISLKQLLSLVKRGIETAHPFAYWVVAEISEIKANYSGHCYLELIEKEQASSSPTATARAIIWRSKYALIAPYFKSVTGSDLTSGMKVLVKATVQYSEIYGFSLQISDIDPTYTIGDNERQKMQTIEQLKKDGVYDMNRECELPMFIQKVAVISSKNAAGYEDFMRELESQWNFNVSVFEAFVQGSGAEESIITALENIADDIDNYQVVVIIRGGGSQSDLGCFDSYRLCSHIAQFPLPIITGIGHNKDVSVADMVAAVSLKTPTAVAVFLKETASAANRLVDELRSQVSALTLATLEQQKQRLSQDGMQIQNLTSAAISDAKSLLQKMGAQISIGSISQIQSHKAKIDNYKLLLRSNTQRNIATQRSSLEAYTSSIKTNTQSMLLGQAAYLDNFKNLLWAHNPQRLLDIGFAIISTEKGALKSVKDCTAGQPIEITLSDGKIKTEIKEIWKNKSKTSATTKQ